MTERAGRFSQNPEYSHLPEGFEMPTDQELRTEAERDFYEGEFFYSMTRSFIMPMVFASPEVKEVAVKTRAEKVKRVLLNGDYDVQEIVDTVDINTFSKDGKIRLFSEEGLKGSFEVEDYQIENYVRTGANIADAGFDTDKPRLRKSLIKRFTEARIIAGEKGVSVEDVFRDQESFFLLMQKSYSPEEFISENEILIKSLKTLVPQMIEHEARHAALIANVNNPQVNLDEIDKKVAKEMNDKESKEILQKALREMEAQMRAITLLAIERYWGKKTAQLFK